ncbi:hypothetical protein BESB_037520 [Besnoitia besnoiti]|uniref:DUF4470 domain-containing protein n=1 Tax=Besnoitia besnoiti TaxID=94643 RepID=A0A2A9MJC7_BESBE|nr:hypothetical protein BESB_037520 [Besnoitia besnoiti]PFH37294.1 hypothetical protein BESB_037520 [Besnoitia besnoiti]
MAADVSSGLGFIRFWASASALDAVDLCRRHRDETALVDGKVKFTADVPKCIRSANDESACSAAQAVGQLIDERNEESQQSLHILLLGLGDLHHVLFTVSRLWKPENRGHRLHFFVHEDAPEVLARHLLLLDMVNDRTLSFREKTDTFLDVYANTRLLPKTVDYIRNRQPRLTDFVCSEHPHPLDGLVDLTHLKHRQRDDIQEAMEAWHPAVKFDLEGLRDQRLRHFYGQRFDYKVNLMDWNYQMNLSPMVPIIHWRQYKRFALTGVAFEARLADHAEPNRTLSSYTRATDTKRRQSVKVRGFWADIVSGPFYAYGAETRHRYRDRLFRKVGDQQRYSTHDIATFNLTSMIYGIQEMNVSFSAHAYSVSRRSHSRGTPREGVRQARPLLTALASGVHPGSGAAFCRAAWRARVWQLNGSGTLNPNLLERELCVIRGDAQDFPLPPKSENEDKPPYPSPTELAFFALESQQTSESRPSESCPSGSCPSESSAAHRDAKVVKREAPGSSRLGPECDKEKILPFSAGDETPRGLSPEASPSCKRNVTLEASPSGAQAKRIASSKDSRASACSQATAGHRNVSPRALPDVQRREEGGSASGGAESEAGLLPGTSNRKQKTREAAAGACGMRYTNQFDVAIVANVATTPLFKHCGVLSNSTPSEDLPTPAVNGEGRAARQRGEVPTEAAASATPCAEAPPSFLSTCLKKDALVCFETFKYAANLNSVAKLRFRKVALEAAKKSRWHLCNPSSAPPMAETLRVGSQPQTEKEPNCAEATKQEAAADAYMIFRTSPCA